MFPSFELFVLLHVGEKEKKRRKNRQNNYLPALKLFQGLQARLISPTDDAGELWDRHFKMARVKTQCRLALGATRVKSSHQHERRVSGIHFRTRQPCDTRGGKKKHLQKVPKETGNELICLPSVLEACLLEDKSS